MGIIREEDRAIRNERLAAEQQALAYERGKMLVEIQKKLPRIVSEIKSEARWWITQTSNDSVPSASTTLTWSRSLRHAVKNQEVQDMIKAAMLEIEPNTDRVEISTYNRMHDERNAIRITVHFSPALT